MRTVLTLTRSFLFLIVFATLSRCTGFIWTCGEANDAVNGIVDQNDSTRGQLRRVGTQSGVLRVFDEICR